jgi:CubicO group peptidase (beta-lactamase class C family)
MQWIKSHRWLTFILTMLLFIAILVCYTDLYLLFTPRSGDIDSAFIQDMQAAKVPGAAMLIIRNGQVESANGYGLADLQTGRAVTPDTLFTIASISKTATATALMTLYERGEFSLDESIDPYLPFKVRNPNFPDMPITFRMLLSHTSSIQDSDVYTEYYTLQQSPVLPDSPIPLGEFLKDYLSTDGKLFNAKENFLQDAPGTTYKYSNIAFGLVGFLTERISGMPFDVYCKQAVFVPLGMDYTAWYFKDVETELMAVPYGYNDLLRQPKTYGFYGYPTYPDGALKTNVNEFARFLSVFINEGNTFEGKPFLEPETVKEMLALHSYPGMDMGDSVGLAWHSRNGLYFHTGGDPGMFTITFFDPKRNWGAVLFTNGGGEFDVPGLARQNFFGNQAASMLITKMTAQ